MSATFESNMRMIENLIKKVLRMVIINHINYSFQNVFLLTTLICICILLYRKNERKEAIWNFRK